MIGLRPPPIQEVDRLLVPADFRQCVSYLTVDAYDEETGLTVRTPAGTAFYVSIPIEDLGTAVYLVTARHVIDASRPYGQLFVRVNLAGGAYYDASAADQDQWEMHPTTDVAAAPVVIDSRQLDVRSIPIQMLLSDERLAAAASKHPMAEGDDEIVVVGLFTSHPGVSRSEPVVRFGHIARMPYDPVRIKIDPAPSSSSVPVRAYLCEAASYGGQSGSPAFAYFAPDRVPGTIQVRGPLSTWGLLGLVQGHYPFEQEIKITSGDITGEGKVDFNLGISVVIPAQDILDVLNSEALVDQRKQAAERKRAEKTATPDVARAKSSESEFDRFEDLTRLLVNTPKQKPNDPEEKS